MEHIRYAVIDGKKIPIFPFWEYLDILFSYLSSDIFHDFFLYLLKSATIATNIPIDVKNTGFVFKDTEDWRNSRISLEWPRNSIEFNLSIIQTMSLSIFLNNYNLCRFFTIDRLYKITDALVERYDMTKADLDSINLLIQIKKYD